jgi:hypothetical protein
MAHPTRSALVTHTTKILKVSHAAHKLRDGQAQLTVVVNS